MVVRVDNTVTLCGICRTSSKERSAGHHRDMLVSVRCRTTVTMNLEAKVTDCENKVLWLGPFGGLKPGVNRDPVVILNSQMSWQDVFSLLYKGQY